MYNRWGDLYTHTYIGVDAHTHKRVRTRTQTIFLLALRHVSDMRVAEATWKMPLCKNEHASLACMHLYVHATRECFVYARRSSHYCVIISSSGERERAVCSVSQRGCTGVAFALSCSQGRPAQPLLTRLLTGACQQHPGSMPRIILGSGSRRWFGDFLIRKAEKSNGWCARWMSECGQCFSGDGFACHSFLLEAIAP